MNEIREVDFTRFDEALACLAEESRRFEELMPHFNEAVESLMMEIMEVGGE